jgi:hypothetical protein
LGDVQRDYDFLAAGIANVACLIVHGLDHVFVLSPTNA